MKPWLPSALAGAVLLSGARADPPAPPGGRFDLCQALNNRILGPRSAGRALPLLAGDPTKGLRPACTVRWATLSPANQPLDVLSCFQGSLLQIENNSACGQGTGFLWVNSRWVLTSAEQQRAPKTVAVCQELETNAVAATRDIPLDCEPRKKDLATDATPAATAPAKGAPADKPAAATAPK